MSSKRFLELLYRSYEKYFELLYRSAEKYFDPYIEIIVNES